MYLLIGNDFLQGLISSRPDRQTQSHDELRNEDRAADGAGERRICSSHYPTHSHAAAISRPSHSTPLLHSLSSLPHRTSLAGIGVDAADNRRSFLHTTAHMGVSSPFSSSSSSTSPHGSTASAQKESSAISPVVDPFKLVEQDLLNLYQNIGTELSTERPELEEIARYYFDGQGKAFRPMVVVLIARALNSHMTDRPELLEKQKTVAMVTEMIHTASLVHDDVIDTADTRRGKPSVNTLWGQKKAILAGDYILSRASQMLARLRDDEVILILSQVKFTCY